MMTFASNENALDYKESKVKVKKSTMNYTWASLGDLNVYITCDGEGRYRIKYLNFDW